MSITDNTTSLDTAWTEQTITAFTTGVLSTISDCVTEVEAKLKRGSLSGATSPTLTQVQNWLKRAKMELAENKDYRFVRKYAYADLVASQYRYEMPPDYNGGAIRLRDTTNDRWIQVWLPELFDKKYPDVSYESNDDIQVATVKNQELWVVPPPASSDRIELEYPRSGAESTADDFSWLPELERFRCCDFAIAESFDSLHMWAEADRYWQKWHGGLLKSRKADGRKRWHGRLQAISVWQDWSIRQNQQRNER